MKISLVVMGLNLLGKMEDVLNFGKNLDHVMLAAGGFNDLVGGF